MNLSEFNKQNPDKSKEDLFKCCGSTSWVNKLMKHFPFVSIADLKIHSDQVWFSCQKNDWLEAFSHHPKIGDKTDANKNLSSTSEWASQEQSAVKDAGQNILSDLSIGNQLYEKKFGYIYIICATGKTAGEMLDILTDRLRNSPEEELLIAINEQNKITHLRIDKLFS